MAVIVAGWKERFRSGIAVGMAAVVLGLLDNAWAIDVISFAPGYIERESVEASTTLYLQVQRTGDLVGDVSVAYIVRSDPDAANAATAGEDFKESSWRVRINDGESSAQIPVSLLDDLVPESTEQMVVELSDVQGAAVLGAHPVATISILDDDQGLFFGRTFRRVLENEPHVELMVQRHEGTEHPINVSWWTEPVTAEADVDFETQSGTLTLTEETRWRRIKIPIKDDEEVEPLETFRVRLSTEDPKDLGTHPVATVQIDDDDRSIVFVPDVSVGFWDKTARVEFLREYALDEWVSVRWSTRDDTAVGGKHYAVSSGVVEFAPGESFQMVEIGLLNAPVDFDSFYIDIEAQRGAPYLQSTVAKVTIQRSQTRGVEPDRLLGYGSHAGTAVTMDGETIVTASSTGLQVWHTATGRLVRTIGQIWYAEPKISDDGSLVAAKRFGRKSSLDLFDLQSGRLRFTIHPYGPNATWSWFGSFDLSPNNRGLVTTTSFGSVFWNLDEGRRARFLPDAQREDAHWGVANGTDRVVNWLSAYGSRPDSGSFIGDAATRSGSMVLGRGDLIPSTISADGKIGVFSAAHEVEIWGLEDRVRITTLPQGDVTSVSNDGRRVVYRKDDRICVYNAATLEEEWSYPGNTFGATALSPNGRFVVFGADRSEEQLHIVDLEGDSTKAFVIDATSTTASPLRYFSTAFGISPDSMRLFGVLSESGTAVSFVSYDLTTGNLIWRSTVDGVGSEFSRLIVSPDGKKLAVLLGESVHIVDAASGFEIGSWLGNRSDSVLSMGFDASSRKVRFGTSVGLESRSIEPETFGHHTFEGKWATTQPILGIFSESGSELISTSGVLDIRTGSMINRLPQPARAVSRDSFAFVESNEVRITSLSSSGGETTVEVENGRVIRELKFMPTGAEIAIDYLGGTGELRRISDGQVISEIPYRDLPIWASAESRLGIFSEQGVVKVSDLNSGDLERAIGGFGGVKRLASSPDGSRILVSHDRVSVLWDIETGIAIAVQPGEAVVNRDFNIAVIAPTSFFQIYTSGHPNAFDVETFRKIELEDVGQGEDYHLVASPDGSRILGYGKGQDAAELWVWESRTGDLIRRWEFAGWEIYTAELAPDHDRLLIGLRSDGSPRAFRICLLNVSTDEQIQIDAEREFYRHWFSPDGSRLLLGALSDQMFLMDPRSGEFVAEFENVRYTYTAAFSPDSNQVAFWSTDGSGYSEQHLATIVDARNGEVLKTIDFGRSLGRIDSAANIWLFGTQLYDEHGAFLQSLTGIPHSFDGDFDNAGRQLVGAYQFQIQIGIWDLKHIFKHRLYLSPVVNGMELDWAEGMLQVAPSVSGPWGDLPNANPPWLIQALEDRGGFFRVKGER